MKRRQITQAHTADVVAIPTDLGGQPVLTLKQEGDLVFLDIKGVRKLRKVLKQFDLEHRNVA